MGHVICIVSQKGGTGKTTTAVNLAASLALLEKKTLVVDCDPLGNATTGLGINKAAISRSLMHILRGSAKLLESTVSTSLAFLSLIPADNALFSIESREAGPIHCEAMLQTAMKTASEQYDYVIIDSPPSLGYLTTCALAAANYLIVPTQRRIFSFEGLHPLLSLVHRVRGRCNAGLKIAGILFTMIDKQWGGKSDHTPDFLASLKGRLFDTLIPMDSSLADAADYGKPAALYDISAPGAGAYLELAQEVLERIPASGQPPMPIPNQADEIAESLPKCTDTWELK